MSQKFEKLKTLLKELFQLDQPDLDFGLYRIMHAKSEEVTQFLEKDLLSQVKQAFSFYKTADKAELENELATAIDQARALGADPETLPKVKELRKKIASEAVDLGALQSEFTITCSASSAGTIRKAIFLRSGSINRASTPSPTKARRSPCTGPTATSTTSRQTSTFATTRSV